MVKVTLSDNSKILLLRVEGHAGYADIGKDIVCSSASILAYTVAKIVSDSLAKDWLESSPIINMESGKTLIVCEPTQEHYSELSQSYQVVKEGFEILAQNYPQYVSLRLDINNTESLT